MAFYDFISFFELKLSWDISTHDPGSCLDLFHSGKKKKNHSSALEKRSLNFLDFLVVDCHKEKQHSRDFIGGGGGCKVLRLN